MHLKDLLKINNIKVEVDNSDLNINNKIKNFSNFKVPYILVVGNKEKENNSVSIRIRGGKQIFNIDFMKFLNSIVDLNKNKNIDLIENF